MARQPRQNPETQAQARPVTIAPDGTVTVREASYIFGVSEQSVRMWAANGAPHIPGRHGVGGSMRIRVPDMIEWRANELADRAGAADGQDYNFERAKAMDMAYRAVAREASARRELRALVSVDTVRAVVSKDYGEVRSKLSSIPARYSVKLASVSDASAVRHMLAEAISDTLQQLSDVDLIVTRSGGNLGNRPG